jgi:hypothetical protein
MGTKSAVAVAVALAAAALASGCGGQAEPKSYALGPTRRCLTDQEGVKVSSRRTNFVASTASRGAMRVTLEETDNFAIVAFGEDDPEAARIEQAYREFAGKRIPIDDVLERTKNVVFVWNAPPTGEERDTLLGCLKGAG